KRDDAEATRIAEAFLYGMSLVHGPMTEIHSDSLVMRVPDVILQRSNALILDELVAVEKSRLPDERSLQFPRTTIGTSASTTEDRHEMAWRIAAVTVNDPSLFDATRFLK